MERGNAIFFSFEHLLNLKFKSFNKWADLVRKKKYFMQSFSVLGKAMGPNSVLTKNEERLLEFPQYQLDESLTCNVEAEIVEEVLVCRVCLKTPENLVNIHKVSDNDDETLATKINKCSHIEEVKFKLK